MRPGTALTLSDEVEREAAGQPVFSQVRSSLSQRLKGSMHHTHDVSSEDAFCIIHMAAGFYF